MTSDKLKFISAQYAVEKYALFKDHARICGLTASTLREARRQAAKLLGISMTLLKPLGNIGAAWNDWDFDSHRYIEYRVWKITELEDGN